MKQGLTLLLCFVMTSPALAQFCDGYAYMTVDSATSARVVRVHTNPVFQQEICDTGLEVNAVGIDPNNGEILGWDDPNDRLVRIDDSCNATTVALSGPGDLTPRYLLGSVSQDGSTYVAWRDNLANFISVNLASGVTQSIAIAGGMDMSDWAFGPDGLLYGVDLNVDRLITIDPTTGTATDTGISAGGISGGAVWFDGRGDFWIYEQATGALNSVKIGSGNNEIVFYGNGSIATGADGASCPDNLLPPEEPGVAVPTMSQWGVMLLTMILGGLAMRRMGARSRN